jgi:hypothetical protein
MGATQQILVHGAGDVGGDSDFASVELLLHFDGSNGSTTFTDHSSNAYTVSPSNATIDTAQSVFGGASGRFVGTGYLNASYLVMPSGLQLYTVDVAVRIDSGATGNNFVILDADGTNGALVIYYLGASNHIRIGRNGVADDLSYALNPAADTWYRLRFCRDGTNTYIFVDGTLAASAVTNASLTTAPSPSINMFGRPSGGYRLTGYVDEMRITLGVCRSTANYTLDAAAFPNS